MKSGVLYIIIILLSFFIWSCDKEIELLEPKGFGNEFWPLKIDSSISYQIQEINIDKLTELNDTLNYQIKEIVESVADDTESYKTYRLERYYRDTIGGSWTLLNVWQIRQYQRRIHKIEDNIEYIRLLTPVTVADSWDANLFNIEEDLACEVFKIENNQVGDKTAFVVYHDKSSLIDKQFSEEQYSENIGLTSKTNINVELNIDPGLPWEEKITKGTIYYQNIILQDE